MTEPIMIVKRDSRIMEFQGKFENFDLFDGSFDPKTLVMEFKDYTLQGRIVKKDFTVFSSTEDEIKEIGKVDEVVLFDKPPRFKLNKSKTK